MKTPARCAACRSFGDFLAARNYSANEGGGVSVTGRLEKSDAFVAIAVKLGHFKFKLDSTLHVIAHAAKIHNASNERISALISM